LEQHYHTPVLLNETIDALAIKPGGIYVDCTFGGGGHSKVILENLDEKGRLIAFDQDISAKQNLPEDSRVLFVQQNFRHVARFLKLHNINEIDGLLADLGVSSHQFDEAERGFSFRFDAAMDMRMDQRQVLTAAEIIKTYSEHQLHKLFEQYGEVTNAKTLARTIVQVRTTAQLKTIDGFRNAIRGVVKGNPNKYFAQVLLRPGGRAAIITFHSIEDRLVKNFFRRGTFDEPEENPFINDTTVSELNVITKKPIVPTEKEMKQNSRSRSAKLRVAERISS
jgi:16S rRNA (cytosine1402-N4)-methyltransferase